MIKVKVQAKGIRLMVPIPYALLHLIISIMTSKKIVSLANRAIEKEGKKKFQIPDICSNDLKPLLRELSKQKGLLLVETTLKDGTEVSIKL